MTRRRGGSSDDDETLWRLVTSTVRPLRGRTIAPTAHALRHVERTARGAAPAGSASSEAPASKSAPSTPAPSRRPAAGPPPDRSAERRVRRGQVEIWGALDLHGLTQDQARAAVGRFVARAAADGARTVIVVTGKGGRFGGGEGVLKRRFPEWLAEPGVRAMVSGVSPAHPRHGGAGAFYVFLKRQDPARDAFS